MSGHGEDRPRAPAFRPTIRWLAAVGNSLRLPGGRASIHGAVVAAARLRRFVRFPFPPFSVQVHRRKVCAASSRRPADVVAGSFRQVAAAVREIHVSRLAASGATGHECGRQFPLFFKNSESAGPMLAFSRVQRSTISGGRTITNAQKRRIASHDVPIPP